MTPTHPPVDLAAWKQQDYAHMTHAHEASQHLLPPGVPTIGPAPATIGSAEENPLEDEARTQAQGIYYFTKAIAWLKMLTEVPWIKRLVGVSEYSAARAANPFPVGDAALGALEQLMDDERRPRSLSWWQRPWRVFVKASESGITGFVSDAALGVGGGTGAATGGAAEPGGGEFLGLPIGIVVYIGSSLWLDDIVWPSFNEKNLNFLGEWEDDTTSP